MAFQLSAYILEIVAEGIIDFIVNENYDLSSSLVNKFMVKWSKACWESNNKLASQESPEF